MGFPLVHQAARIRTVGVELAIIAGHILLYPTGIAQEDGAGEHHHRTVPVAAAAPPHPPVLLLHGFVDNRSVFALLRRSLARYGWRHVHALNYSPFTWDVRTAARLLARHVADLCERTGHGHVDIVGHSLGGLIARYYVQCLGGDVRVRTLVTLGTPHGGTLVVPAFNPHPLLRQMRPGSELLRELAGPAPGCRTRFVAFWSDADQCMSPVTAARLDHPDLDAHNVLVPGAGHLTLSVHGAVTAGIRRALLGEPGATGQADAA
jgi:pimeloyl-ACP methyl ester carboxylesterase